MTKTTNIGEAGTRVVLAGKVISVEREASQWGYTTLFKIRGSQGELAFWRSSHDVAHEWSTGMPITVRCTVEKYKLIAGDLWVKVKNGTIVANALAIV